MPIGVWLVAIQVFFMLLGSRFHQLRIFISHLMNAHGEWCKQQQCKKQDAL